MLEFDLLIFSFGQLPLALMTWVPMFLSTLLVPYQVLRLGERPRAKGAWVLRAGLGCVLLVAHTVGLCALPVLVALKYQLPPASRCILVFEQVTRRGGAGRAPGKGGSGGWGALQAPRKCAAGFAGSRRGWLARGPALASQVRLSPGLIPAATC